MYHDLCFEQKLKQYHHFLSKYYLFYSLEKVLYITWASFRNVMLNGSTKVKQVQLALPDQKYIIKIHVSNLHITIVSRLQLACLLS